MQVNFFTFKNENFVCPNCGWRGKGDELSSGEFSESDFINDLDCPSCYEHIGFWQAPLKNEIEKWKAANPGITTGWDELDNH
ncbi:MAG TPA: hypothetical protein VMT76_08345 [Puia sp.]|nr:hypothetical protein [Puia sp.]